MRSSPLCSLFGAAVVMSTACSDATAPEPSGSMSFTYHGSAPGSSSGSFAVVGARRPFVFAADVTGAVAGRIGEGSSQSIEVVGSSAVASQEFSITIVGAPGVGVLPSCEDSATDCVDRGHFWPDPNSIHYHGAGLYTEPPYPEVTVTITELTASRIRGTFQGMVVGACGQCSDQLVPDTLTISAGEFDVPFRQ